MHPQSGLEQFSVLILLFCIKDIACLRALADGGCLCPLTDGRPLTLDEIWGSVHASYQACLQEGPWDTITQQVRILWSFTKLGNAMYA